MPNVNNKYLFFDCDGVLVDSEHVACELLTDMLAPYGCPTTPKEMMEKYVGMKDHEIVNILAKEYQLQLPVHFMELYTNTLDNSLKKALLPIEGIKQVLDTVRVPRAIVSNSHLSRIVTSLKSTNLFGYFNENEITSADLAKAAKPDPAIYRFALQKMGWEANQVVVVEDSPTGVAAAAGAGLKVVGFMGAQHVLGSQSHEAKLLKNGAWKIAHNSVELGHILNEFCH